MIRLRSQILLSVLGITVLCQVIFGFMAYRQISESRGDQLTIFLQYLNREVAERLTTPGDKFISEIYLEELRDKFSTPASTLFIQKNNKILYSAGDTSLKASLVSEELNKVYSDKSKHGLIHLGDTDYYWAVSTLPDKSYQLVMIEPAVNEENQISSALKQRLIGTSAIIIWLAVWISLILSSRISKCLDEKNDQLEHQAMHDSLTGLPNRKLLNDRLDQLLLQSQREKLTFALFMIDLDRFKEINDTLGHQFGDEILKIVSNRLTSTARVKDSISRLGGDEFAVLLPHTDYEGAKLCAERILETMATPFSVKNVSTESKASIGIAIFPEHGNTSEALMQHADIAMYQAKKSQSGYAIYNPAHNKHSLRKLKLMTDLRKAVEDKKIQAVYQPLLSQDQKTIIGVEALARWQHFELGNISPDEFIPMAEQIGVIRQLTFQILEQAATSCRFWHDLGYNFSINVNLSTYCLQDLNLPNEVSEILKGSDLNANMVEFEITESALMHDLSRAGKILSKLSDRGFQLAIDDFGTGFSSLRYLKNLPIDTLKIDKSFITDMNDSNNDLAIVKTIIELGHNLNCRVVAEGVEDQHTINNLTALEIDVLQGYFYSKPLDATALLDWLTINYPLPITQKTEAV